MRTLIVSLLLASAAASPALADRPDWGDRDQARAERQQAREDRQQAREDRQQERQQQAEQHVERVQPTNTIVHSSGGNFTNSAGQPNYSAMRAERNAVRDQRVLDRQQQLTLQRRQRDTLRQQRIEDRQLRQQDRPLPNVLHGRVPVVSDTPRFGTQPPLRVERRTNPVQWNTHWRNDHRYDWHNYRRHHRSLFHLGFYYDPFGWGYQPYSIGWRLWPAYYGSQFWIDDPWYYRLPYAPPGTRWVRYYDDALLVDTWSGQVIDVIRDFFW